jgi:hypothetical protein
MVLDVGFGAEVITLTKVTFSEKVLLLLLVSLPS